MQQAREILASLHLEGSKFSVDGDLLQRLEQSWGLKVTVATRKVSGRPGFSGAAIQVGDALIIVCPEEGGEALKAPVIAHEVAHLARGDAGIDLETLSQALNACPDLPFVICDPETELQAECTAAAIVVLADGRALVSTRMYASLREIWQGWSKNMCTADTGQSQAQRLAMYGLYGLLSVAPFVVLLWSVLAFTMAPDTLVAVAGLQSAAQVALIVAFCIKINEIFRVGPWHALAHPLAGAIFLGMMAGCGLRTLAQRGVRWKGRRY